MHLARQIADTAHRMDLQPCRALREAPSQTRHHGLDGVRRDVVVEAVEAFLDQSARHDLTDAPQEDLEQIDLAAGEIERAPLDRGRARRRVEGDATGLENGAERRARPPQQSPAAGEEFLHLEGLDDVVVGAGVETGDPLVERTTRRGDDHRRRKPGRPAPPQPIDAVAVGQAEIEDDDVETGDVERRGGGLEITDRVRREAAAPEAVDDEAGEPSIVLDHQCSHAFLVPVIIDRIRFSR